MYFPSPKKEGFLKSFWVFFILKNSFFSCSSAENKTKEAEQPKQATATAGAAIQAQNSASQSSPPLTFSEAVFEKDSKKSDDSGKKKASEMSDIKDLEKKQVEVPILSKKLQEPSETIFFFQEEEPVQIKETFEFPISKGIWDLYIESLPRGLIKESLLIEVWGKPNKKKSENPMNSSSTVQNAAPIFLKNQIFSNNLLHYNELLESFIGKPVKIKLSKSANSEEKVISGILLGFNEKKEPMIFYNETVDCYPEGYILFPFENMPKIFPSLFLKIENNIDQKSQLVLHFLCKNIAYNIVYLMEIDVIKNEMILQGQMILKNESGKEFHEVKIYWIDRLIQKKNVSYSQNIKKILLSQKIKIPSFGEQTIPFLYKKLQPQVTYHVQIPFSFVEIETKQIQNKKILPTRYFSVPSNILNLKEIPDGNLSVYIKQSDQIPIYFLAQRIKSKNSEELQIPLDAHSEIQINIQEIQWRKISEKRKEVTFYILVQNNFSEQTFLYLHQPKKNNLQFIKSHEDPSLNNENELVWTLDLPAKSISRFWYRIIVDAQ